MESDAQPTGPVLSSGRVTLRPFRAEDASRVAVSCKDPEIPKFTMMPDRLTEQQALAWIERRNQLQERGLFALARTATDTARIPERRGQP